MTSRTRDGGAALGRGGKSLAQTEGWEVPPLGFSIGYVLTTMFFLASNPTKVRKTGAQEKAKVGSPEAREEGAGQGGTYRTVGSPARRVNHEGP